MFPACAVPPSVNAPGTRTVMRSASIVPSSVSAPASAVFSMVSVPAERNSPPRRPTPLKSSVTSASWSTYSCARFAATRAVRGLPAAPCSVADDMLEACRSISPASEVMFAL